MQNSYNYPIDNDHPVKVAVAARISGDKSAFYDCTFLGFQDTVYDYDGRHYFKNCTITGAIDFIFGNGQSIYEVKSSSTYYILLISKKFAFKASNHNRNPSLLIANYIAVKLRLPKTKDIMFNLYYR